MPSDKGQAVALIISALFSAGGLYILAFDPAKWHVGLTTLVLFGGGGAILWMQLGDQLAAAAPLAPGTVVSLPGGVRIASRRRRFVAIAAYMVLIGGISVVADGYPIVFRVLCAGVGILGLGLMAQGIWGPPRQWLELSPAHVWVGKGRWGVRMGWDQLGPVLVGAHAGHPVVHLYTFAPDGLEFVPPGQEAIARRKLRRNGDMLGTGVTLMPGAFGMPATLLAGALERYRRDEGARQELDTGRLDGPAD